MIIKPIEKLSGEITLPGDKSISHRAIMLGAIANGITRVKGVLACDDCNYTAKAFRDMGIAITKDGNETIIKGKGLKGLKKPEASLNAGESGTTMRILAGILAGQNFEAALKGSPSLSRRPMDRIVQPLLSMGVDIRTAKGSLPPITVRGGEVKPIDYKMPVASAQVKSAILFAGLYARGVTRVEEKIRSRDHTEKMMKFFGADIKTEGLAVLLKGPAELKARELEIPSDISSASFFMVGATLVKGSSVLIKNVGINPTRAGIIDVLKKMGANIKIANKRDLFEPVGDISIESAPTNGIIIEEDIIPAVIDELPVIFVLAALSRRKTVIKGIRELRVKETDRVESMLSNLKAMGADISVDGDNVVINGVDKLNPARIKSFDDHRTCMAMAIAALTTGGESDIDDVTCANKSFPDFFNVLKDRSI